MGWSALKKLWILCCLVLCLTACGGEKSQPTQKALDFRTGLMEAGGCSFTAVVTADYGEKVYSFTLDCSYNGDKTRLRVLEPESIAGIAATVSGNGAVLEFDGVELEFGKLANGFPSPVAAPWLLGQCWTGEYIAWAGPDGDLERITYLRGYDDEELTVDTWLDANRVPVYAEVAQDGVRCLTVEIKDFRFEE